MEITVTGNIVGAQPHQHGNGIRSQRVKIGFFLRDTLQVIDEDGEVTNRQCCCEQKFITIFSSQVNDLDYIKQLAYQTLHNDMHMDSESAAEAKSVVASTIRDKVVPARNNYPLLSTILLEIRVVCIKDKRDEVAGDPSGEHGYDRFLERLDDGDCPICCSEFDSTDDIIVTACHHTYHLSCLFELLGRSIFSCPMCRSDLESSFKMYSFQRGVIFPYDHILFGEGPERSTYISFESKPLASKWYRTWHPTFSRMFPSYYEECGLEIVAARGMQSVDENLVHAIAER
ncbi:hypothetical protein EJ110_NYTH55394 [Nymphaea thermarum]|nr:hypothetical protein EJ110_NYTH55394 [Nymphaea thermarum]